eukprot:COSAG04_NODE_55_length_30619_cov_12.038991_2_plen_68_part_00
MQARCMVVAGGPVTVAPAVVTAARSSSGRWSSIALSSGGITTFGPTAALPSTGGEKLEALGCAAPPA